MTVVLFQKAGTVLFFGDALPDRIGPEKKKGRQRDDPPSSMQCSFLAVIIPPGVKI